MGLSRFRYPIATALVVSIVAIIDPGEHLFVFEKKIFDAHHRFHAAPAKYTQQIIILDITEDSIRRLESVYGRWPWPRSVHAEVIEYLNADGARVIGFDILFPERSLRREVDSQLIEELRAFALNADIPEVRSELVQKIESLWAGFSDKRFVSAVGRAGNVILPSVFSLDLGDGKESSELIQVEAGAEAVQAAISRFSITNPEDAAIPVYFSATLPFDLLADASRGIGHINYLPDADGVCRRYFPLISYRDKGVAYPGFPLLVAAAFADAPVRFSEGKLTIGKSALFLANDGTLLIRYQGGKTEMGSGGNRAFRSFYTHIPYDSVLASLDLRSAGKEPLIEKGFFRDKIVLVSASAAGLSDQRATPFSPITPGIEIHANIIDNLLSNRFLHGIGARAETFSLFLLSLLIGVVAFRLGPYSGAVFSAVSIFLSGLVSWNMFGKGFHLPVIKPLFVMAATYLGVVVVKYLMEERERKWIKNAFGHYIAHALLEEILGSPEKLKLGGEKRYMTVLFSDIEGFTALSEGLPPEETAAILNGCMTSMVDCIRENKGTLDKFIGDAVMAFWNAPLDQERHAFLACETALMMIFGLKRLSAGWKSEGKPVINIRIGVHTGDMVAGNMGSKDIFNYTVLGAEVNTASRLEALNKEFGTRIIVSEKTRNESEKASPGYFLFRRLGHVQLKGTTKPLPVSQLLSFKEDASESSLWTIEEFEKGLALFSSGRLAEAGTHFQSVLKTFPSDGPSKAYLRLCRDYLSNPAAETWTGVYIQKSK